ncbi:TonB-dependent receptor [Hymenobacter profundi]|uniref:Outer membrane beta-barrel protein n=1 Tax=Hymenobacter profundi TaxID=1982110 RepID=A0ABS6WXC6_9BACT|nr:outer membrane beta-barrel protein [Hymenobacter profundi]MBW3128250.1 outer membrane beta-barrel protein [Hymenobacter profundi]
MQRLFLFVILLLLSGSALAQTTLPVTGRVEDAADKSPLIGANVVLIQVPDSVRRGAAVDTEGNFSIADVPAGRYILAVSFLGYQTIRRQVQLTQTNRTLGTLPLQAGGITLKGVEVVGKTPAAVQKGDTAQYNANAFKTNPDADARDLVTKMPGITVQDGKVNAQGEQVQKILVDGKEFFGTDPDAAMKNIPAEIIDKIEVFDRQSEQSQFSGFNDGNTQKTINIVTKPQYRKGQFGRLVLGAGPERYQASVSVNSFNGDQRISLVAQSNNINMQNFASADLVGAGGGGRGGRGGGGGGNFLVPQGGGISTTNAVGLNYSDQWGKKTQVTGSYFFNQTNNRITSSTDRQYATQNQRYLENSFVNSRNINHRANLRLEHKIDSANSILFIPRLSFQQNTGNSTLDGQTLVGDVPRGVVSTDYRSRLTGINSSNQLLYRHRFAKAGRTISLDLNANYNSKDGNSNLYSLSDTTVLDQYATLNQQGWELNSGVSYTEPLSKKDLLQFNYNVAYTPNDSDKKTYDFSETDNAYSDINAGLSNVFTNTYLTQGIGASYRHQTETLQASAGVTAQKADLDSDQRFPAGPGINRTFYNILPNAQVRYRFSREKNLRLNYNGRTSAPGIGQLQEVVNNANPLQLTTGNPNLRQQYQHVLALRYSASKPEKSTSFFAGIFGTITDDYITNSTFVTPRDTVLTINGGEVALPLGGQLTRPVNLGQQFSVRAFSNYGLPLNFIKTNLNLNGSVGYSRTPGINNGVLNYSKSPNVGLGITLSSNISTTLDFTVSTDGRLTYARNTTNVRLNTNYYVQNSSVRLSWTFGPGINLQTNVTHQYNQGLSAASQQYLLWNASIGKRILPGQRGEIKLYAFDILKQNQSIQNNITVAYNERVVTNNLQQYFMLMFTYNLRRGNVNMPTEGGREGRGDFRGGGRPSGGGSRPAGGRPPGGGGRPSN